MLAVLSPAKSLDFSPPPKGVPFTVPEWLDASAELIEVLRKKTPKALAKLMDLSESLATLNAERYRTWSPAFSAENAKQCLLAFVGDVYKGLSLAEYRRRDYDYAQEHVRILSGLHGVLRPLDLIQPYRLEMGTALRTKRGVGLYRFWKAKVAPRLNADLAASGSDVLVNLASEEYFTVIEPTLLKARVVTAVFQDWSGGKYKILSFFAKRARGMMADFMIRERVSTPEDLREFGAEGYSYAKGESAPDRLIFRRKKA